MGRNTYPQKHGDGGHTLEMLIFFWHCLDLLILGIKVGESTFRYSGPPVASCWTHGPSASISTASHLDFEDQSHHSDTHLAPWQPQLGIKPLVKEQR